MTIPSVDVVVVCAFLLLRDNWPILNLQPHMLNVSKCGRQPLYVYLSFLLYLEYRIISLPLIEKKRTTCYMCLVSK